MKLTNYNYKLLKIYFRVTHTTWHRFNDPVTAHWNTKERRLTDYIQFLQVDQVMIKLN